jgi:hypothetical protein
MMSRIVPAVLAAVAILLGGLLVLRIAPRGSAIQLANSPRQLPSRQIADAGPVPDAELEDAAIGAAEEPFHAQPIDLAAELEPTPLEPRSFDAGNDVFATATYQADFAGLESATEPFPSGDALTADSGTVDQPVLHAEGNADMSLRAADFPKTYISAIHVDLKSPNHWVRLTWTGPRASEQETGPFRSTPGAGLGNNDCDDEAESNRNNSNCTPKGTRAVEAFSDYMVSYPTCRFVTWFDASRGIAFHSHSQLPRYPASHGCVRLNRLAAQLIHNNSLIDKTMVTVEGTWSRHGR